MKFYGYFKMAERDRLITPFLNFSELSNVYLTFDHAYTQRFNQKDSLVIYISSGCEENWTRIWANGPDGNGVFETSPANPYEFIPMVNDDWCSLGWGADCFTLDLSEWAGDKNVRIAFEAYNNLGNNLYLDNITVSNTTSSADILPIAGSFIVYPNPGNGLLTLHAEGFEGQLVLQVFNVQGQIIKQDEFTSQTERFQQVIDLQSFSPGVYTMKLIGKDHIKVGKLVLQN